MTRHFHRRLCSLLFFSLLGGIPGSLPAESHFLEITPSALILRTSEKATLDVVDETGRPIADAVWSLDYPIADLVSANNSIEIRPKYAGRAILTASIGASSATALISIVDHEQLPPTTIRWSLNPWPGYESLFLRQSESVPNGPDFFDVEWSKTAPAIIRGLRSDGRQLWIAHLRAYASPETIKPKSPLPVGRTTSQDGKVLPIDQMLLLDDGSVAILRNSNQAKQRDLPPVGRSVVVHDCGDGFGGLVFLERNAEVDFLVDVDSAGKELWRYRSIGRLTNSWTINFKGEIGVVETTADPPGSSFILINGQSGAVTARVPVPKSSTTIRGLKCVESGSLTNIQPAQTGAPVTSQDGNIYLQAATLNESVQASCPDGSYTFDNTLSLLQVTPEGEGTWHTIEQIHSDGTGNYHAQSRVFAGETIPDGFGGVLAAWTYSAPGNKEGETPHFEAHLTRLDGDDQHDFTLPMPGWTRDPSSLFDTAMVLGDDNVLIATNGYLLLSFDTTQGNLNWIKGGGGKKITIQFATAGGGVLVSAFGRLGRFDIKGENAPFPWTVSIPGSPDDIGFVQFDPFDFTPEAPIALRDVQAYFPSAGYLGVEDDASNGTARAIMFSQ